MANTIKPKRSYTLSSVPSGLAAGELAVNASATPKIWIGNSAGTGNVLVASLSLSDMAGSTTNITEGTNLYYTDARARAAVSAGTGITYSSSTGVITADAASANTASKLVIRDASGNFSAGTITASLTGTASTATNLAAGSGGTIPYQSAAGTTAMLSNGTAGQLLQANGGTAAPSWVASPGVPTGSLFPFAGSAAPTGYLLCDASAVSRTTYATLFGVIGTTYGSGDGSTTFNLPDLRGRLPMGAGTGTGLNSSGTGLPSGTAQTARTMGQWFGEETHALTTAELASHTHANTVSGGSTGNAGSHSHTLSREVLTYLGSGGDRYDPYPGSVWKGSAGAGLTLSTQADHSHTFTPTISNASAGSGSRHNTIPPCVVLNYIIKT